MTYEIQRNSSKWVYNCEKYHLRTDYSKSEQVLPRFANGSFVVLPCHLQFLLSSLSQSLLHPRSSFLSICISASAGQNHLSFDITATQKVDLICICWDDEYLNKWMDFLCNRMCSKNSGEILNTIILVRRNFTRNLMDKCHLHFQYLH